VVGDPLLSPQSLIPVLAPAVLYGIELQSVARENKVGTYGVHLPRIQFNVITTHRDYSRLTWKVPKSSVVIFMFAAKSMPRVPLMNDENCDQRTTSLTYW
jgi:hypothetical protein